MMPYGRGMSTHNLSAFQISLHHPFGGEPLSCLYCVRTCWLPSLVKHLCCIMGGGFWSQKILQVFLLTVEGIVFVFFPGCTLCGSSFSGFISELSGKPLVKVQVHCQAKCLSEESEHLTDVFFFSSVFSHTLYSVYQASVVFVCYKTL